MSDPVLEGWWEQARSVAGVRLPAALQALPPWLLVDAETRRLTLDSFVRRGAVGVGWTGGVLLDAVAAQAPVDRERLGALFDTALEGPLWLDVGDGAAALEGAIFTFPAGPEGWLARAREAAGDALGPVDARGAIPLLASLGEDARVAGTWLSPRPAVSLGILVQRTVVPGAPLLDGAWERLADRMSVEDDERVAAERWAAALGGGGAALVDVLVPVTGAPGLTFRWWNARLDGALAGIRQGGADEAALARVRALVAHSRREDVARSVLQVGDGVASVSLMIDLGLTAC